MSLFADWVIDAGRRYAVQPIDLGKSIPERAGHGGVCHDNQGNQTPFLIVQSLVLNHTRNADRLFGQFVSNFPSTPGASRTIVRR